jgi:hypothetical protein
VGLLQGAVANRVHVLPVRVALRGGGGEETSAVGSLLLTKSASEYVSPGILFL